MATDETRLPWGVWPAASSARISKGSDEFDPHPRLFTVTPVVDSRHVLGSLASLDQRGHPMNTVYLVTSDEFDPPLSRFIVTPAVDSPLCLGVPGQP